MALEVLVLLVLGVVAAVAGLVRLLNRAHESDHERPVLPSHYSSLLYTDRACYPGHCTTCGTDNEPGYRYCEACGGRIPTSSSSSSRSEVRQIFNE